MRGFTWKDFNFNFNFNAFVFSFGFDSLGFISCFLLRISSFIRFSAITYIHISIIIIIITVNYVLLFNITTNNQKMDIYKLLYNVY